MLAATVVSFIIWYLNFSAFSPTSHGKLTSLKVSGIRPNSGLVPEPGKMHILVTGGAGGSCYGGQEPLHMLHACMRKSAWDMCACPNTMLGQLQRRMLHASLQMRHARENCQHAMKLHAEGPCRHLSMCNHAFMQPGASFNAYPCAGMTGVYKCICVDAAS